MMGGGPFAASPTPSTSGGSSPAATAAELAAAAIFLLVGIRSLVRWLRTEFTPVSIGDRLLYVLHVTARVGMWFAFGGFFAGYAVVDEPWRLRWYVFVPIGLASAQLLTGLLLSRSPGGVKEER